MNNNNNNNNNNMTTLCIYGEPGVGKTSLSKAFVYNEFSTDYNPTFENIYNKEFFFEDIESIKLQIIDTAGEFLELKENYSRMGDCFVLVYSINCRGSFKEIKSIRDNIISIKETNDIPIIIVANKIDLDEKERKVSTKEGMELAESLNCPFLETSAKENINVTDIFTSIYLQWKECNQIKKKCTKKSNYAIKNINYSSSTSFSNDKKKIIICADDTNYSNQSSYLYKTLSDCSFDSSNLPKQQQQPTTITNNLKHNTSIDNITKSKKNSIKKPKCYVQ